MFAFDETHRAVEAALRDYCTREIEPHVMAMERGEVSPYDVMRRLSSAFSLRDMAESSLAAARASRSKTHDRAKADRDATSAGAGTDVLGDPALSAIFAKELSRVSPGLCLCVAANMGCGATIAARANPEIVERYAVPVLSFEKVGCWGLTEPGSGSDAFSLRTRATIEGDTVVLSGSKTFISNAPAAEVFLVYARVDDPGSTDKQQIFPVIVERGTPGLSTGPAMQKLGMHAAPTGEIFLDECRVPRSHLLGDPSRPARDAAEATLSTERAAIVAMCVGVIERCLEESLRFSTRRVQFGRPIAGFQLIQEKLARMYVALENSRNVMFKLIWQQRHGSATERETSAAKLYASEAAASVALEAVQLMGGAGYMQDSVVERLFRDIKLWTIGGGTSEIQLLTIAKDLLKGEGVHIDFAGGYRDI